MWNGNTMKALLFLLAAGWIYCSVTQAAEETPVPRAQPTKPVVGIEYKLPDGMTQDQPVLAFAASELQSLLAKCGVSAGQWTFVLEVDAQMEPYTFAVAGAAQRVTCRGQDPAGALHAVYTALERIGICFEATGPVLPEKPAMDKLSGWSITIHPAVLRRGIRQHLNFPMDISSYTLEEAKEYIRNLARLRMNYIVFHSYGGQWFAAKLAKNKDVKAGAFFYNVKYPIPDQPLFKNALRNKAMYCIPEIEPYFDQPEERSQRAIQWLRDVMQESKRTGLSVRFSFESRTGAIDDTLAIAKSVIESYPMLDCLELVTGETLDDKGVKPTVEELSPTFRSLLEMPEAEFNRASTQPSIAKEVPSFFQVIVHSIRTIKALEASRGQQKLPSLCVGVYCPTRSFHRVAVPLLRQYVPQGVEWSLLPSHGAVKAAENLELIPLIAQDWQRAMIYSWIEFDGSMYLQQNALEGIRRLVAEGQRVLGEKPISGICLNHWRTAENRTTMRYAATAMLAGPVSPDSFYRDYAATLGVGQVDEYAVAMKELDAVDTRVRDTLFNIGFCYLGTWGTKGLGKAGRIDRGPIMDAIDSYQVALRRLRTCATASQHPAAKDYLAFLDNRISCSVLHLQAMEKLVALQPICINRQPKDLTEADRKRVREICDDSLALMDQYMALHAEKIADRGCEGTLINYSTIPPVYVRRVRAEFGELPQTLPSPAR